MKVAIYTIMFSLHQTHVADELYSLCGNDFRFFEMRRNVDIEKAAFIEIAKRPYLVRVWEGEKEEREAMQWAVSADVARFSNDESVFPYLKARLDKNLLSFETGERWLKKGMINMLSPRFLKNIWHYHTLFRRKPFYKLCASAFAANDQYLVGTFKGRCYKWGYFTQVENDVSAIEKSTEIFDKPTIMWCARFLEWKHPEMVIKLARRLKDAGRDVQIDMYGTGVIQDVIKKLCDKVGAKNVVTFKGNVSNEDVLYAMRQHDLFLFTSDRNEGWGAVLNEAMSNGCAVVASDEIGAVPFLVKHMKNGMIFRSGDLDSLYEKVVFLIDHPSERNMMARNAYLTMRDEWSPKQAAMNFLQLSKDLLEGKETLIKEGPCSKAVPLTK